MGSGSPEQEPQMEMGPVQGSLLPSHPVVTQPALLARADTKALEDKGRNHTRRISWTQELLTERPAGKVPSSQRNSLSLLQAGD